MRRLIIATLTVVRWAVEVLAIAYVIAGIRWTVKEYRDGVRATQPLARLEVSLSQALLLGAVISIVVAVSLRKFVRRLNARR